MNLFTDPIWMMKQAKTIREWDAAHTVEANVLSAVCKPINMGVPLVNVPSLGIDGVLDDFRRYKEVFGQDASFDEFVTFSLLSGLMEQEGLERGRDIPDEIFGIMHGAGRLLHADCVFNDPYVKNINIEDVSSGDVRLHNVNVEAGTCFEIGDIFDTKDHLMSLPAIGIMLDDVRYPVIGDEKSGFAWMTVDPCEIAFMQRHVGYAKGRVLTLGCGLGYFAYLASEKPEVKSITVVEKSCDVLKLFTDYILPQFPHGDKIRIMQDDAISFMERTPDDIYDYCFADIWINQQDFVPYVKLRNICRKYEKMKCSYWIEDRILSDIQRSVFEFFLSQVRGIDFVYEDMSEALKMVLGGNGLDYIKKVMDSVDVPSDWSFEKLMRPETFIELARSYESGLHGH